MIAKDTAERFCQVAENIKALMPDHVEIEINTSMSSIVFPKIDLIIRVIGNHADFDFARAVAADIFRRERTSLLIDVEQPRVSIWDRGDEGAYREVTNLVEEIELPSTGCRFTLGCLYDRVQFHHRPSIPL